MAAYEVLLLNTAIPQIQAAQSGDTYVVPRDIAFSAALTLSAGTANGVPYLNASKVLTTGSALTFDGTNFNTTATTANFGTGGGFALQMGSASTYGYIGNSNSQSFIQINGSANATPNQIQFGIASTEAMRLTSTGLEVKGKLAVGYSDFSGLNANGAAFAGNVGIGTSSPQSGGITVFAGTAVAATTPGVMTLGPNSTTVESGEVIGRIQFYSNDASTSSAGVVGKIDCIATGNFVGTAPTALTFHTNDSVAGTITERARISSDGTFRVKGAGTAGTTDAVQFAGGAPPSAMTLDASGNLQLATTTSSNRTITVGGTNATIALAGSNGGIYFGAAGTPVGSGGFGENAAIARAGGTNFHITGSVAGDLCIAAEGTKSILFGTSSSSGSTSERARITSGGDLLVGTQTSGGKLTVEQGNANANGAFITNQTYNYQTLGLHNTATANDNILVAFGTEASYTTRGSIQYNRGAGLIAYLTTSDYRAKDISGPVVDSGALIDSVPVYMGKMKGATQERPMFIAHETPAYAHTGVKDAVDADGKPVYQQMDASALVPVMWAEIQSLRARVAQLEQGA